MMMHILLIGCKTYIDCKYILLYSPFQINGAFPQTLKVYFQ